jgi:hypothetical protein
VTLALTPLDVGQLGADAQRTLANPATKMMASRGLAPIADPRDLLAVLYQLAVDPDEKLRTAAAASAEALPTGIATAGLGDPKQDARVLDWFAHLAARGSELLGVIVRNPAASPHTIARIARVADQRLCDMIADNEQRLLANPAIIGALYVNRDARMSTVDKAIELAIRSGVVVEGIAAWDELVQAYSGNRGGEIAEVDLVAMDASFAAAAHANAAHDGAPATEEGAAPAIPLEPAKELEVWQLPVPMKIRLATMGNAFDRAILIRDPKKIVSVAVIKSPGVTEIEAAKYAGNAGLCEDVIVYIANKREWTKLYGIKLSLVNNPKCPLAHSMRLLPHLREKDLQMVARSKGIPSALAQSARKLAAARMPGGGK